MIHEQEAWAVAHQFADEVKRIIGSELKAVAVIGSLAGGGYRPGISDIDTCIIVCSELGDEQQHRIQQAAVQIRERYHVPKAIGAVIVRERELLPPFEPTRELVPEILRLKHQGVIIEGAYDLASLPEPDEEDFKAYARVFYPWLRANYIDFRPDEAWTVDAMMNTILYEMRLYVWAIQRDYVMKKDDVLRRFRDLRRYPDDYGLLSDIELYLQGNQGPLAIDELETALKHLSAFVRDQVKWSR